MWLKNKVFLLPVYHHKVTASRFHIFRNTQVCEWFISHSDIWAGRAHECTWRRIWRGADTDAMTILLQTLPASYNSDIFRFILILWICQWLLYSTSFDTFAQKVYLWFIVVYIANVRHILGNPHFEHFNFSCIFVEE